MRLAYRIAAFVLITALSALVSCGGQGLSTSTQPAIDPQWPGHGWEGGARSGAFVAVAVDSTERSIVDLTQRLRLEATTDASGTLVTVYGSDVESSAYVHLKYDESKLHPTETQRGATLDENMLFLGIATQPGVVDLGVAPIGGAPMPGGEIELAQVHFAPGAFSGTGAIAHGTSVVASQAPDDLHYVGDSLVWSYNQAGDFDQNSETNIADLTPLGVHLNHMTNDGQHDAADMVVDGDHNGQVNIAELTVIGANFLKRTTDYQIQTGPSASGPWTMSGGGAIAQSAGVLPAGGGFLEYNFAVASPAVGTWYSLQAFDGTTGGPRSNTVQYGVVGGAPPQNLTSGDDGSKITLNWDPPVSGTPDGYDAFVADNVGMNNPSQLNAALITSTTFDCSPLLVPVGVPHFFAVKAVYGTARSAYSNIASYGGGAAPTNLSAAKESTQIRLNWDLLPGADSYNAYVADDAAMTGAQVMNFPGAITTPTFLCPVSVDAAVEHYFAVTAVTGTDESAYSNIAHYTPGGGADTTPPQWQGGTGIRSAEPDNGQVKIYWWPAVDPAPASNPVQYYIYYVEDGTPIDWGSPVDVVVPSPPTNTTYTIPGLVNGQKYEFAVRAADSATPTPNVTSNTNTIKSTPFPYPDEGNIGTITSSDIASVRTPGEETPRVFAVNHSDQLWYAWFDGVDWQTLDINAILVHNPDRKYHPQAVAVGNEIHLLFATSSGIYEIYGEKDSDPVSWTQADVDTATSYQAVYGTGFSYVANGDYLAACWAADNGTDEKLYYADRDASGVWSTPEAVMDGQPSIWQCDMAISEVTGAQWIVAPNGVQVSQSDCPEVWYATRTTRGALWTSQKAQPTIKSSTEITVEIDPTLNEPVMVNPTTVFHPVDLAGDLPATDAGVYTWTGSSWSEDPNSPLDLGDANNDQGTFVFTTVDTGRDPQLVFTPTGKAVAVWEWVEVTSDYSSFDPNDVPTTVTGSWRIADRPTTAWSSPSTKVRDGIFSSNSVTAGESYQHCLTCYVGASDFGDLQADIVPKYGTRNNFPEGSLYYFRQAWP